MIEDHWETRQEYIKQGNELAALASKQEKEKKEREKALKEMEEKMNTTVYQTNNTSSSGGELRPLFVPNKQDSKSSNPSSNTLKQQEKLNNTNVKLENNPNLGMNLGRQNFQSQASVGSNIQRPFSQNSNPFMGNNRNF